MNYNLIVNYYTDKNPVRAHELNFCILENISNRNFTTVMIISSQNDYEYLLSICPDEYKSKLLPLIEDKRPTYNDYFRLTQRHFSGPHHVNVIANTDIIIPAETLLYSTYFLSGNSCLALTRWDISNPDSYKESAALYNTPDSQDAWFFIGAVPLINGADFTLGMAGCDNKIAYLLEASGYEVKNPSKTLKTFHYHISGQRNYTDIVGHAIERLPPPYKLIHPTE